MYFLYFSRWSNLWFSAGWIIKQMNKITLYWKGKWGISRDKCKQLNCVIWIRMAEEEFIELQNLTQLNFVYQGVPHPDIQKWFFTCDELNTNLNTSNDFISINFAFLDKNYSHMNFISFYFYFLTNLGISILIWSHP